MPVYERRWVTALALLFIVLFFSHIYLHKKQAVHLTVAAGKTDAV